MIELVALAFLVLVGLAARLVIDPAAPRVDEPTDALEEWLD